MNSDQKEAAAAENVDVEMELAGSVVKKCDAIETSDKTDGHNTSGASADKKPAKKKKKSSNQSHKKLKKDPNKPEYPRVGMYWNCILFGHLMRSLTIF